jgi:hypothetical protein
MSKSKQNKRTKKNISKHKKQIKNNKKKSKKIKGGNLIKILIYCHKYIINLYPDETPGNKFKYQVMNDLIPYFLSKYIEDIFEENQWSYDNVNVNTIDVLNGGTFTDDGFSDDFILQHQSEYDLVFVPDCAGKWIQLQNENYFKTITSNIIKFKDKLNDSESDLSDNTAQVYKDYIQLYETYPPVHEDFNELCLLIQKLGSLVKPTGILFCSKIMDKTSEFITENINEYLPDFTSNTYAEKYYGFILKSTKH